MYWKYVQVIRTIVFASSYADGSAAFKAGFTENVIIVLPGTVDTILNRSVPPVTFSKAFSFYMKHKTNKININLKLKISLKKLFIYFHK